MTTTRQAWAALWLAFACLWLAVAAAADDLQPVPPLAHRVTDTTNTLTPATRAHLEERLARFEAAKGAQVAVLIVGTTKPEEIEQYGIRVVDAWKLGRAAPDDGVLLLIAKDDRRMRIEVGYGLEGALPDAIAKRIISQTIAPMFRNGAFDAGVTAGVEAILARIEGEPLPAVDAPSADDRGDGGMGSLVVAFIAASILGRPLRAVFGVLLAVLACTAIGGVLGWLLTASVFKTLAAAGVGGIAGLLGGGGGGRWASHGRRRGLPGAVLGGFGGGGFGGGGFGGGGFGGGGFSGGGGGFGGGGASGNW